MDLVATAATEMASTVAEIARNATQTSQATQQAIGRAKQGDKGWINHPHHPAGRGHAGGYPAPGGQPASGYRVGGEALSLIKRISDRTNLLALTPPSRRPVPVNPGAAFAVVADEVRALASRPSRRRMT